ncbi:substrate-binding periplasmic protein [Marinobacter fonticola]|uniref:substrate-binding periplasmic protein n=1 Tax=Marinobacter fonticola TaxID=2603215 RepID=UPI0011E71B76|nr:transporter substrate-binding domain-containing protein [Marinobacter fonticola]
MKAVVLYLALLVLVWSSAIAAKEAGKSLSISVGDWPPYLDRSAPDQGSLARLIRDIFAAEGFSVEFHFLPWNRAYREAARGRHDATAVWMFAPERTEDFLYSDAVLSETFVLFYRKGNPIDWLDIQDLAKLRLGGTLGYSYGSEFDQAVADNVLNIDWVSYSKLNFNRLIYDRIDAFPEEINVGYHLMEQALPAKQAKRITHHPRPILENQSFVLFPSRLSQSKALIERFNERLSQFRESGRYDAYFEVPGASFEIDEGAAN